MAGHDRRRADDRSRADPGVAGRWISVLASAGLLSRAQAEGGLGFLAWFALVPWWLGMGRAGPLEAALAGAVLAVVHVGLSAGWLVEAFASQGAGPIRAVLGTLFVGLVAKGWMFAGTGWLVWRTRRRPLGVRILAPSLAFGAAEWGSERACWGLPLLLLGHSQPPESGVAQLASLVGVPGLSALLLAANGAMANGLAGGRFERRWALGVGLAGLVLAGSGFAVAREWVGSPGVVGAVAGDRLASGPCRPLHRPLGGRPRADVRSFLLVQTDLPANHRWDPAYHAWALEAVLQETRRAIPVGEAIDLILWPESLLVRVETGKRSEKPNDPATRRLRDAVDGWNVPVVGGLLRAAPDAGPGRYRNSVGWWSPGVGLRDTVDKVRAIPLVESGRSFPGRSILQALLFGTESGPRVAETSKGRALHGEFTLSPILCFEVLFPGLVAGRRDPESVALVVLADSSWLDAGVVEVLERQLERVAAYRAIEARLPLLRVSNGGSSLVLDRFGRRVARLPARTTGHLLVELGGVGAEVGARVGPRVGEEGGEGRGRREGGREKVAENGASQGASKVGVIGTRGTETWIPDVDSNHNSQIQSLLSCR